MRDHAGIKWQLVFKPGVWICPTATLTLLPLTHRPFPSPKDRNCWFRVNLVSSPKSASLTLFLKCHRGFRKNKVAFWKTIVADPCSRCQKWGVIATSSKPNRHGWVKPWPEFHVQHNLALLHGPEVSWTKIRQSFTTFSHRDIFCLFTSSDLVWVCIGRYFSFLSLLDHYRHA